MKYYTVPFFSLVAMLFSSCAIHPCGKSKEKPCRSDYEFTSFNGKTHKYQIAITKKPGSPLLINHGLGGLNPATLEWARALGDHGWKVYLPLLDSDFAMCNLFLHKWRMLKSGIWETHDLNSSGQVLGDMEALADWISKRHNGKKIVAVGNCLTGAFPLALLSRQSVKTAVLCQPALPAKSTLQALFHLPQSVEKRRAFGIPEAEMEASLQSLKKDSSKHLYGFHYFQDAFAPMDKFLSLHEELARRGIGGKFRPIVIVPETSDLNERWWERMTTTTPVSLVRPHPTLTGSDEPDRTRLRARFDQLVRP